jgi:hypothetical protein
MSTHAVGLDNQALAGAWEKHGQIYCSMRLSDHDFSTIAVSGYPGSRKHPTFAQSRMKGGPFFIAWTEGTGWQKGASLAWECVDANGRQVSSGRAEGVPVWDFTTAVAEPDGSFSLIY